MATHRSLSGADLHDPQGKFPTPLSLNSNVSNAYLIEDDNANVQFSIDTSNSASVVAVGNTVTNPDIVMPGSGDVGIGTDTPTSPNGNTKVVEIEGESVGVVLHSTNGGGTPYEIQNNSETFKLQYDTTNRMTIDNTGKVGFGADPSSPNGNAKVVEIKDTSVGLVLNSTNGGAAPWEMQHNSGSLKIIYDGADTLGGGAKTAIELDAEGAMRLGAEVATPSAPAAGDGGQVYVKSDGILYYQSNTVAETDLTDSSGTGSGDFSDLTVDTDTLVANVTDYLDKVGIGTATPAATLEVSNSAGGPFVKFRGTNDERLTFYQVAPDDWHIYPYRDTDSSFKSLTLGDAAMKILSTGKVGIGTTSPDLALEINSSNGNNLRLTYNDSTGSAANCADLQVSSSGYVSIKSSATTGQSGLITTTVPVVITGTDKTYTVAHLLGGLILRDPTGAASDDVTPTGTLICAAIPNCSNNDSFRFLIRNTADAAEPITLNAGADVTIDTGSTATIAQNNTKEFLAVVTDVDANAVTVYSLGTYIH